MPETKTPPDATDVRNMITNMRRAIYADGQPNAVLPTLQLLALLDAVLELCEGHVATGQRARAAEAEVGRLRAQVQRVRNLPHTDACCAVGCSYPRAASGYHCEGTEADCWCIVSIVRTALDGGE